MSWCSQEQGSVSQNTLLAALPRCAHFHCGFLEDLTLRSSAICLLIFCGHTPVSGGILTKTESFLEGRLVGELAGKQTGLLSALLLLESTCSRGTFHFDKSAFFQWKTFCQNISAHFCCVFILVTLCPDGKIWLLRLARIGRSSLQARCWTCCSPIRSPWAMSVGCDIRKIFLCSFSATFLLHYPARILATEKNMQVVVCPLTMFMSFCVRQQKLGVILVYSL